MQVRLLDHQPILPFAELKAFQIGKFVTVRGHVVRVSAVRPLVRQLAFRCARCRGLSVVAVRDGVFRGLAKCLAAGSRCSSKSVTLERDAPETRYVNWQKIKIQEIANLQSLPDEGRIPRILEAELTNDLVDMIVPGETVRLSGILKTLESASEKLFGLAPAPGSLYLDVVAVQRERSSSSTTAIDAIPADEPSATATTTAALGGQLIQEIVAVSQNKNTLQTLVKSFCPHIYGNELVKMGLLLGLFGGSRQPTSSAPRGAEGAPCIRSDPHVLIVGDPGLGKSQLLNFAAAVAPRAVYVCANTSTAVGLTATVQDGALEAGALVLADQGACCIDEFDKIVGDSWRSLLDVMEQQTVNVAKAGVVCALPARTSILAAANPVGGHYCRERSVVENLKMDAALLSRFDLIFLLLDRPNPEMDKVLSEHVLGGLKAKGVYRDCATILLTQTTQAPATLKQKLDPRLSVPLISERLLRAYIAYAKHAIAPRMTEEAAEVLQTHYLELRKARSAASGEETLPITARHLESMIRLAEARAKMELRSFVTLQDAQDVVELCKFCSADVLEARGGVGAEIGGRRGPRPGSKQAGLKRFVTELIRISSRTGEIDFTLQQLQALYDTLGVREIVFRDLLDLLNEHGYILKRSTGFRLLVT